MLLLTILDILLIVVGGVGMGYQALCILISLFAKPVVFPAAPMDKRYAVLISARNEEAVIGNLIRDIQLQSLPPTWQLLPSHMREALRKRDSRMNHSAEPDDTRDIQLQSYPTDLIDIWVVADNCTDSTALATVGESSLTGCVASSG